MTDNLWNKQFPVNDECVYLNHAAVAPWPECSRQAVIDFATENTALGASMYPNWSKMEAGLKRNLEALIDAPKDTVALVKNTSEALSFVAYGLSWQSGDTVVITDQEFPSNRIVWESLQDKGVNVVAVPLSYDTPEKALLEAIAQKPRLVSISAVQYASGLALDLETIGAACKANDVLFCVDAIQAVGAMPFSVESCQCDFAMADGHKWMLGPEGLGFFYVRPEIMEQLSLNEYGWHMVEAVGDYDRKEWELANSARRFECGSPNMLAATALKASTGLLLEVGMPEVAKHIQHNVEYLAAGLQRMGAQILNPLWQQRPTGIIGFTFATANKSDMKRMHQTLMQTGVVCAHRGGGVRFSPHFHTTEDVLNAALEAVEGLVVLAMEQMRKSNKQ